MRILGYIELICGSYKVYIVNGNLLRPTYYSRSASVKNEESDYVNFIENNLNYMTKYSSYFHLRNAYDLNYIGFCYDIDPNDYPNIIFEPDDISKRKGYLMFTMNNYKLSDSELTRLTLLNATFINQ